MLWSTHFFVKILKVIIMECINCCTGFQVYPENEKYCAFCGTILHSLKIDNLEPDNIIYIDEYGKFDIKVKITNTGIADINIGKPYIV